MSSRRQAEHQETSFGVAETRDRSGPILLVPVSRPFLLPDPLTPLNEPRTCTTLHHVFLNLNEQGRGAVRSLGSSGTRIK